MKLTDLSIIFLIILLPIVAIVYINTSYVVKASKEEMYYESLVNSAIDDATNAMKQVENEDLDIDYGYSGIVDNKVSINADTAINTFYNSLFANFGVSGNKESEERLKTFIPAIAVLDYDGIYIHSAEKFENGEIEYVTKPKKYFVYNFCVVSAYNTLTPDPTDKTYTLKEASTVGASEHIVGNNIYQVTFTMDDYIYLNIYTKIASPALVLSDSFYLQDKNENEAFISQEAIPPSENIVSADKNKIKENIISLLQNQRQKTIAELSMKEISYAINAHNDYAEKAGVKYKFILNPVTDDAWYETVNGVGMIAIIQGIPLGNRYLNYKAYGLADLTIVTKYYISEPIIKTGPETTYLGQKLYHSSDKCPIYEQYIKKYLNEASLLKPKFFDKKNEAASNGYMPCPICKP